MCPRSFTQTMNNSWCQWSLADFWSLWRIVEMLYIFIYWLPHKLAQPVYTGRMPHEVHKVTSQPLCTCFFNGWQWRSVLSIHAYMLKICSKSFSVQVAVISPDDWSLCPGIIRFFSQDFWADPSSSLVSEGAPETFIMSSEAEKVTGSPIKCWRAVDSG